MLLCRPSDPFKRLSDLEKWREFLSNDMVVFAFVNLGTVSNHFDAAISLRESFILDGRNYNIEIGINHQILIAKC